MSTLFCERCHEHEVDLVKIKQPSTLGHPLSFWVCMDETTCRDTVLRRLSQRPVSQRPALVSDLYPD